MFKGILKVTLGFSVPHIFNVPNRTRPPSPTRLSNTPAGHTPRAYVEDQRTARSSAIQSASRVRAGTGSRDPRACKPFPVTASDKGADRSHKPNTGHAIPEVAVENGWPCVTGGPSGRDDLLKSRRDLLRGPAEHAVTCGASGSPSRD
jgi:hypothetical protein